MPDDELALWRFSLIAPLLHRGPHVSLTEMARQLAAEVRQGPDGTPVAASADTLLRWCVFRSKVTTRSGSWLPLFLRCRNSR